MNPTRRSLPFGLRVLTLTLVFYVVGLAHNGELPPVPAPPPALIGYRVPPRWSWVHWWEASRDEYLTPRQDSAAAPAAVPDRPEETRKRALAALMANLLDQTSGGSTQSPSHGNAVGEQGVASKSGPQDNAGSSAAEKSKPGQTGDKTRPGRTGNTPGQASGRSTQAPPPQKAVRGQKASSQSSIARLRSASLLALARMGLPEAFDTIADAAHSDPDPAVRRTAILSLGLLGTPEAEKMLAEDTRLRGDTEDVRTAALGLLKQLGPRSSDRLQSTVANRNPDLGSIATWGLQSGTDTRAGRLFGHILKNSPSAWLASDGLLFLGRSEQYDAIPLLAELLLNGPGAIDQITAYRVLNAVESLISTEARQRQLGQDQAYQDYLKAFNDAQASQRQANQGQVNQRQANPRQTNHGQMYPRQANQGQANQGQANQAWLPFPPKPIISGEQMTYAAELRGSGAMALGMLDDPRSREALLRALNLPDDPYSDLYKGPTLISLGQIGDERCLRALIAVLSRKALDPAGKSQLRGYAAMGLGLYARSNHPGQSQADGPDEKQKQKDRPATTRPAQRQMDRIQATRPAAVSGPAATRPAPASKDKFAASRPAQQRSAARARPAQKRDEEQESEADRLGYRRAIAALSECLLARRESVELRTSCALALGLSQRHEALPALQAIANPARREPETLVGYSLLARGLLHDRTLIEPAQKLLDATREKTDMNALLAQRAAILGLGLLDDQDAIPVLQEAWNLNYYASREVILALSLSRSTTAGDVLLDLLEKSEDPQEQAYLSLCIGEVFARDQRSPLSRFISDTNYMMKNENLRPYQSLANEFLLNYLMPAFGDQWR